MNYFTLLTLLGALWVVAPSSFSQNPSATSETRFQFRERGVVVYRVETAAPPALSPGSGSDWIKAWPEKAGARPVELGSRVVLQLKTGAGLESILNGRSLRLARTVSTNVFILQAPDAPSALREAQRLAPLPDVLLSHPVQRRQQIRRHGPYAARPDDTYFSDQWNLENRSANGASLGLDLNVRAAWPATRGEGAIVAVADDGVELSHPEFVVHADNGLHFNFETGTTNAMPVDVGDNHSTAVAGLALAEANNGRGMAGVAPSALLASWKIFRGDNLTASDEAMMDMFQYRSNVVCVENHSWGNADFPQLGPTPLESIGIANAIAFGRGGRGVVMVRSAGNGREESMNANDDGYANDSRVITVAGVRSDGRAASYSNPGACVLVAAPGGDADRNLFTTDRQGSAAGFNTGFYTNDFADYASSPDIFGTSFATPQVAGLSALVLSANTNLAYRDVQQILILSARHFDLADADLKLNGAGLGVSHNVGFGVPDAGWAVALAAAWTNRPALTTVTAVSNVQQSIPDDGLRVVVTGTSVPPNLLSIPASPGTGPHADSPTASLPLVDVGLANAPLTNDLTGKAALIQRGGGMFFEKIGFAAQAGAAFAIIYNHIDGTDRFLMGGTDFVPIPAVMIDQNSGEALRAYLQQDPSVTARIQLNPVSYIFNVTNALICEHIGVRMQASHSRRGDLRITLLSPQGTRSVLQHVNLDDAPGPSDWTYSSTHHFFESSTGAWTVSISDEEPLGAGTVQSIELILRGVAIADTDADGLDDGWETARLGSLASGPKDDPDGDGYSNAREQIMGTDPNAVGTPFRLDLSVWNETLGRLSWPSMTNRTYEIFGGSDVTAPLNLITNLPGRFPETEWFTPYTNLAKGFFRVRAVTP
ncbi:MAG TPA: S8 family serine peptidase [Verrucomicrobiae bacterium]|nr:S8 family serine peptidase [Verrucomicrobiae bacterium]